MDNERKTNDDNSMVGINLGDYCNQNCLFCLAADGKETFPRLKAEESIEMIKGYIDNGGTDLMVTGGECTINPDIVEIIAATVADDRVHSLNIMTNGVKLSDKKFYDDISAIDPKRKISYSFSLHGPNSDISESITRGQKGDFKRTCDAIETAIKDGRSTDIAFIILEQNYKHLPEYAEFITKSFPAVGGISFGYPLLCGNARVNKDSIYAKFSEIAPYLAKAIEILESAGIKTVLAAGAPVPLCVLPGVEDISVRPLIEWHRRFLGTATVGLLNAHKDESSKSPKMKVEACEKCVLNGACEGVATSYHELFGADGIDPVTIKTFKGPVIRAYDKEISEDKLDQKRLNIVIIEDDGEDDQLTSLENGSIAIVIRDREGNSERFAITNTTGI
ncbi:MAG: radical SAM protein [Candidatus Colwellbacteria bacterium]|nr:radical SAM protein [Candidatus Colwellbacteria bacterium]